MCLVYNDRKAPVELGHLADETELLQGGDDDLVATLQRRHQLFGVAVDLGDHPFDLLELLDGVPQLPVKDDAVGDDHDAVKKWCSSLRTAMS